MTTPRSSAARARGTSTRSTQAVRACTALANAHGADAFAFFFKSDVYERCHAHARRIGRGAHIFDFNLAHSQWMGLHQEWARRRAPLLLPPLHTSRTTPRARATPACTLKPVVSSCCEPKGVTRQVFRRSPLANEWFLGWTSLLRDTPICSGSKRSLTTFLTYCDDPAASLQVARCTQTSPRWPTLKRRAPPSQSSTIAGRRHGARPGPASQVRASKTAAAVCV